ncbi:uncharacterized protein V1516DRAFT_670666 [Lipomyces oligophaga]|uniref:uncharacterized protein n=1 Tax=Lipomyces oligophaga TaxID=45792 RepID=UPI0034CFBD61
MSSFYAWYNARLAARPLLTQCASTGFLFGTGDFLAQMMAPDQETEGRYNYLRTVRMTFHGACVFAPVVSKWYVLIGTRINMPGKPTLEAMARMAADQLVWAPVGIASFYVSMGVLQLHSWNQIKQELQEKWYPTMVGNYMVWPAVQVLNFRLIPLQYRLMFVNVVSIAWNTFLSWFSSTDIEASTAAIESTEHKIEHKIEDNLKKT